MLVRRCAWHVRYRGYPLLYGVAVWSGRRLAFTDGLCAGCAARIKRDGDEAPELAVDLAAWARPALAVAVLLVPLLVPRSIDQGPPRLFDVPAALALAPVEAEQSARAAERSPLVMSVPGSVVADARAGAVVESVGPSPTRRPARSRRQAAHFAPAPTCSSISHDPDPAALLAALCTQAP